MSAKIITDGGESLTSDKNPMSYFIKMSRLKTTNCVYDSAKNPINIFSAKKKKQKKKKQTVSLSLLQFWKPKILTNSLWFETD